MCRPESVLENEMHKIFCHLEIKTDHQITTKRPNLAIIKKKKRTCSIVKFAVPVDHRLKIKKCEKRDKYLHLAREQRKLWNMRVTAISIIIGALRTVLKGLERGLENFEIWRRIETIQTTTILKSAKILRRLLETWGDLLSLKLQGKTISLLRGQ